CQLISNIDDPINQANLRNVIRSNVNKTSEVVAHFTDGILRYYYSAGANENTSSNYIYEGYHVSNSKTSNFIPNGYYVYTGESPNNYALANLEDHVFEVVVEKIWNGKIEGTSYEQVTIL